MTYGSLLRKWESSPLPHQKFSPPSQTELEQTSNDSPTLYKEWRPKPNPTANRKPQTNQHQWLWPLLVKVQMVSGSVRTFYHYSFENVPIKFVDLHNICLATKIMFLWHLETEIYTIFITYHPFHVLNHLMVTSEMMPKEPDGAWIATVNMQIMFSYIIRF